MELNFIQVKKNAETNNTDFCAQLFEDAFYLNNKSELVYAFREAVLLLAENNLTDQFIDALKENTSVFEEE